MKQLQGWWTDDLSPHLEILTSAGEPLDVVVDSGFNGELMLPVSLIEQLGLDEAGPVETELADGSTVWTTLYAGEIRWFDKRSRCGCKPLMLMKACSARKCFKAARSNWTRMPIWPASARNV
jgi:hypothetical protein